MGKLFISSANAVRGIPFFCCSLAFATENKLSSITDAVVTNLLNGDLYWATKGKGAYLNDTKIHVNNKKPIYRIVGVNTSGASPELMSRLQPVLKSHNHPRHFGSIALEMAFFARGLMDVLIDLREKIRILDIAAGYLLIKETGGLILDVDLKPLDSELSFQARLSFIAAANQEILDDIMSEI